MSLATAVFFDTGRGSWVVEYDSPDRQEHFGSGPHSEERARQRAAAMGLPIDLQVVPIVVDLSGRAFSEKDSE